MYFYIYKLIIDKFNVTQSIKGIFKYSINKANDYEERISNLENDLKRMTNERKEAFEV